jgi:hypothetical protein
MTDRELLQKSLDILSFIDTMGFIPMLLKKEFIEVLREKVDQPEKEWVWLTKEEKKDIFDLCEPEDRGSVAAMVEAKLKEKNDLG